MHRDTGGQGDQSGPGRRPRWSSRTKRVLLTGTAGALLLGSGAAVGIAMTGGASAATGSSLGTLASSTGTAVAPSASASPSPGTSRAGVRCAGLVEQLVAGNHLKLAKRLDALCTRPLLRLALVGGEHGQVTFKTKTGTVTAVFERGTVESDTGSTLAVTAADGTTWSWTITGNTVARQNGSTVSASDLSGDQVFVVGTVVNGANDARLIRVRSAG